MPDSATANTSSPPAVTAEEAVQCVHDDLSDAFSSGTDDTVRVSLCTSAVANATLAAALELRALRAEISQLRTNIGPEIARAMFFLTGPLVRDLLGGLNAGGAVLPTNQRVSDITRALRNMVGSVTGTDAWSDENDEAREQAIAECARIIAGVQDPDTKLDDDL